MKKFNGRHVKIGLDQWCKKVERKHAGLSEQYVPSKPSDEVNDMLRKQAKEMGLSNFDPTREDKKPPKDTAEHASLRAENFSGLRGGGKKGAYSDAYDGFQRASSEDGPLDLSQYISAKHLEEVGLEKLKKCLQGLGMKCGGTLTERAERLWLTKGVTDLTTLDIKLFSNKKKKKSKNEGPSAKRKRVQKGPLRQGHERLQGQKKLHKHKRRWKKPKEMLARRDNLGTIL